MKSMWKDSSTDGGKIRLKTSHVAAESLLPSGLVSGEVALNAADGKLLYKDNAGAVQTIPPAGYTGSLIVGSEELIFVNGILTQINMV